MDSRQGGEKMSRTVLGRDGAGADEGSGDRRGARRESLAELLTSGTVVLGLLCILAAIVFLIVRRVRRLESEVLRINTRADSFRMQYEAMRQSLDEFVVAGDVDAAVQRAIETAGTMPAPAVDPLTATTTGGRAIHPPSPAAGAGPRADVAAVAATVPTACAENGSRVGRLPSSAPEPSRPFPPPTGTDGPSGSGITGHGPAAHAMAIRTGTPPRRAPNNRWYARHPAAAPESTATEGRPTQDATAKRAARAAMAPVDNSLGRNGVSPPTPNERRFREHVPRSPEAVPIVGQFPAPGQPPSHRPDGSLVALGPAGRTKADAPRGRTLRFEDERRRTDEGMRIALGLHDARARSPRGDDPPGEGDRPTVARVKSDATSQLRLAVPRGSPSGEPVGGGRYAMRDPMGEAITSALSGAGEMIGIARQGLAVFDTLSTAAPIMHAATGDDPLTFSLATSAPAMPWSVLSAVPSSLGVRFHVDASMRAGGPGPRPSDACRDAARWIDSEDMAKAAPFPFFSAPDPVPSLFAGAGRRDPRYGHCGVAFSSPFSDGAESADARDGHDGVLQSARIEVIESDDEILTEQQHDKRDKDDDDDDKHPSAVSHDAPWSVVRGDRGESGGRHYEQGPYSHPDTSTYSAQGEQHEPPPSRSSPSFFHAGSIVAGTCASPYEGVQCSPPEADSVLSHEINLWNGTLAKDTSVSDYDLKVGPTSEDEEEEKKDCLRTDDPAYDEILEVATERGGVCDDGKHDGSGDDPNEGTHENRAIIVEEEEEDEGKAERKGDGETLIVDHGSGVTSNDNPKGDRSETDANGTRVQDATLGPLHAQNQ